MRPKFQKRSALKFDGRIIPEAKPSGINAGLIPRLLGPLDTTLLAARLFILYSISKSQWGVRNSPFVFYGLI